MDRRVHSPCPELTEMFPAAVCCSFNCSYKTRRSLVTSLEKVASISFFYSCNRSAAQTHRVKVHWHLYKSLEESNYLRPQRLLFLSVRLNHVPFHTSRWRMRGWVCREVGKGKVWESCVFLSVVPWRKSKAGWERQISLLYWKCQLTIRMLQIHDPWALPMNAV